MTGADLLTCKKLFEMVKRSLNGSVNAKPIFLNFYEWNLPPSESLLTIKYRSLPNWQSIQKKNSKGTNFCNVTIANSFAQCGWSIRFLPYPFEPWCSNIIRFELEYKEKINPHHHKHGSRPNLLNTHNLGFPKLFK